MLVTPFEKTKAYELGIVDEKGKILRKANTLTTDEEKDAYNYLTRLIFNVKRLLNKLPGGESKLKNIVAAYYLVKESYAKKSTLVSEERLAVLATRLEKVTLVEEEIEVQKVLDQIKEDGAVVANSTGASVSTNEPVIKPKDIKKYKMATRGSPLPVGVK
jgi:hypothetical protein